MRKPQADAIGVASYSAGFISQILVQPPSPKSLLLPRARYRKTKNSPTVVRQFIQANRAVNEVEKDF
jgi:hypothetical protein